jgi:quinol monooxygenase YgiN
MLSQSASTMFTNKSTSWLIIYSVGIVGVILTLMDNTVLAFSGPIALNAKVSVKPERRDEFLSIIQHTAEQTVETEQGSLQFTLGEDTCTPNTFYCHEQYTNVQALEHHQTTRHFLQWSVFCATDPFTAETVENLYQCSVDTESSPMRKAFCLNVELCINPQVREEFLACIDQNQKGSRLEPLCYQYDFGESVETPNSFYFH